MSIKVSSLAKTFGHQKAVDSISFEATNGDIVGFLGPNGAGKSTTMKMALGYIPPTSGKVEICGLDVVTNTIETRKRIGYLPEHNPLYLDMYVHEYLRFAGSMYFSNTKYLRERIHEMIDVCGLGLEQNKKIGALSKGYRQRVGLAQALLPDPEVLILDEPTTGLDPNQLMEIRNMIKNVSTDKTVLFSTHIMQEVQAICNRVIIINKGRLVADAEPSSLEGMASENCIILTFKEKVSISTFDEIKEIRSVDAISENKFKVTSAPNEDIRPKLFELAQKKNLSLLELTQDTSSLEDVFKQLTNTTE